MINFDDYANENKTIHNKKLALYPRSSIQNINNRKLRVWENKFIIEFNRKLTRH